MFRTEILDGLNGIHPKCIDVKVAEPHEDVLYEKLSYAIAVIIIKINRLSPGSFVFIGEVGAINRRVISLWTKMIVHHIEYNSQTFFVTGIHQFLKVFCTSV